jgi:hypothetical protein
MLDCSVSHGYALPNAGELESFLSGRSRKITVASHQDFFQQPKTLNRAQNQLDIEALVRELSALANDADRIARRLERERSHELHRASAACRDFVTAVRLALAGLPTSNK